MLPGSSTCGRAPMVPAHLWCPRTYGATRGRTLRRLRLYCRTVVWIAIKKRPVPQSWSVVRQPSWRLVVAGSPWSTVVLQLSLGSAVVGVIFDVVEYSRSTVVVEKSCCCYSIFDVVS